MPEDETHLSLPPHFHATKATTTPPPQTYTRTQPPPCRLSTNTPPPTPPPRPPNSTHTHPRHPQHTYTHSLLPPQPSPADPPAITASHCWDYPAHFPVVFAELFSGAAHSVATILSDEFSVSVNAACFTTKQHHIIQDLLADQSSEAVFLESCIHSLACQYTHLIPRILDHVKLSLSQADFVTFCFSTTTCSKQRQMLAEGAPFPCWLCC